MFEIPAILLVSVGIIGIVLIYASKYVVAYNMVKRTGALVKVLSLFLRRGFLAREAIMSAHTLLFKHVDKF